MPPSNGDTAALGEAIAARLPLWAKAIVQIGGMAAIALYLTYIGAQTLPAIRQEVLVTNERLLQSERVHAEMAASIERLYVVTLQMCANAAHNGNERDACFRKRE
jgi:hypothetical protein